MGNRHTIGFIVMVFTLIGCNRNGCGCGLQPIYNTSVNLMVEDSSGTNILSPYEEDAFSLDSIRLYYLKDNRMYDDQFNWYDVYENEDSLYVMLLGLHSDKEEDTSVTLIQWPNFDMDTIKGVFSFFPEKRRVDVIYAEYNGEVLLLNELNKITKEY